MSLEDLHNMGLLREEGHPPQRSGVRVWRLGSATVIVLAAAAMMVLGNGNWLTASGIALFLVGFFALIRANLSGVMKSPRERDRQ
jgi:hypothetical protein